ncbi:MAG TPA: hypothetical protein VJT49_31840 [Amycolatopsis sp.]|uniref:hypothetical protein n=1 Tax=Amycolatopsis sp. TaxID=37632 RepID=UPI002B49FC6C|nr:hypothetical protein [Amycolatopsis sp.]HKS49624.1 hypothetical protein [Amycolatopsis sp.]
MDDVLDRPVHLYPLAYLDSDGEVTVGRPEIDSYAVLPADGAAVVRRLEEGMTPRAAAGWYAETYGEDLDIGDLLGALEELGFVRADAESAEQAEKSVRWQRSGRAMFSLPAWICYGLLVAGGIVAMAKSPRLVPHFRHVFFTDSYTVIELVLFLGQFPLLLVHESFHALAGRRLGLASRLSVGRRLYYIVFETSLDGLVMVPHRKRILPILAGMLADVLVVALLTLIAAASAPARGVCLALAYLTLLRLAWQFFFYLRTDLYVLFTTVLGCVDLHTAAKGVLRNAFRRLLGRPPLDESRWHPTDRRVARWYAWLMLAGYLATWAVFGVSVLPIAYRFLSGVLSRFTGSGTGFAGLLDSAVFVGLNVAQFVVIAVLVLRDRRRRREATPFQHVLA